MKPTNKKPVQVNFSSTRYKSSKWILNEILIEFKWIIKGVLWLANEFYWVIVRLNLGNPMRFTKNVYFFLEKSKPKRTIIEVKRASYVGQKVDVGELKLVTIFKCRWLNFDVDDFFWMLVPEANVKRLWILVTKMVKTVTFWSFDC